MSSQDYTIDSKTVAQHSTIGGLLYEVGDTEAKKLASLGVALPGSAFIYSKDHHVFGFLNKEGAFDTLDEALIEMVWPGYNLDVGFTPDL